MKLLVLNSSPRRRGNISMMLQEIVREAEALGYGVTELNVHDLSVRPCTACMECRSSLRCALPEDDGQRVLKLIRESDAVVIGVPCYWGNMPGTLKVLFDRMVYGLIGDGGNGFPRPLHKGKRAIVVSTSTTRYPFNIWFNQTRGAVRAVKEVLKYSGFKTVAVIQKGGTRVNQSLSPREIGKCRQAVHRL